MEYLSMQTWIKSPFLEIGKRITSQPPSTSLQVLLWWGKIPLHSGQWGFPFGLSILLLVARCHLVTWRHFTQHPIQLGPPWQPPGPASSLTFAPKSLVARSWITIFACKILDVSDVGIHAEHHSNPWESVFYNQPPRLQTLKQYDVYACLKEFIGMKFRPEFSAPKSIKIHTSSSNFPCMLFFRGSLRYRWSQFRDLCHRWQPWNR